MTVGAADRPPRAPVAGVFAALAILTVAELLVAGAGADDRLRTTTLTGLLLAKTGLLLFFSLRATWRRPAARLVLLALPLAAGLTVVLMLEAVYRTGIR